MNFLSYFKGKKVPLSEIRAIVKTEILWQGNAISCMKTFGKMLCRLCMREKLEIHNTLKDEKRKANLINSANELYGA